MSRWTRAAGAVAVVGAALVVAWWSAQPAWRFSRGHWWPEPDVTGPLADPAVARAALDRARAAAADPPRAPASELQRVWLCRHVPPASPRCVEGRGADVAEAAEQGASGQAWLADGALTLDVAVGEVDARWPADAAPHDAGRLGIEVGPAVVLPWEVLTRHLFRAGDDDAPSWDEDALARLLRERGGAAPTDGFRALRTVTWAQPAPGSAPTRLERLHAWDPPDAGDPRVLADAARAMADHLVAITGPDGRVAYRLDPTTGRELPGQNLLRHAGSAYALAQAYARFGDPATLEASRRAIGFLLGHTVVDERQGPHGGGRARHVVEGPDVKLGGVALALVAIDTWREVSGVRDAWAAEAGELATFLLSQQREDGQFVCFPSSRPGGEPRDGTSDYYPGEAVLALALHASLDPDPRWLAAAERGAGWLAEVRDAGKGPSTQVADHWYMIATSRLYAATGDERWVDEGRRVARSVVWQASQQAGHERFHHDFLGGFYDLPRSTPSSIRAEGLAAVLTACEGAGRSCADLEPVLLRAVGHALWSQVTPATSFWVTRPELVVGGVTGGVADLELRDDYTQHALSAALGAEAVLRREAAHDPR